MKLNIRWTAVKVEVSALLGVLAQAVALGLVKGPALEWASVAIAAATALGVTAAKNVGNQPVQIGAKTPDVAPVAAPADAASVLARHAAPDVAAPTSPEFFQ